MKDIPDKSVDLVVTSPPYNLGASHHTGNKKTQAYRDNLQENVYQKWQIKVLNELFRIVKDDGSLIYNHKNRIKNHIQITPYEWLLKTKWIMKQEIVWFNGSQNYDKRRFYPMTERVYWLSKMLETKLNNTINHHDLFTKSEWVPVGSKGEHTRASPIKLVTDILKCFPDKKIIIDPFLGSGTTAIACLKLNRNYIGIEISPEYCKMAEDRIKEELRQQKLF